MMRGHFIRSLFLLVALLSIGVFPGFAQSNVDITSFTTSATVVGRTALAGRTARIPVSWSTANRPLTANLFFEQVLPDGSTINVELPRVIPFVASNGDGVAAPILPNGEVSSIKLRVSLVNLFTHVVYDSVEIVIPIVDGNSGGNGGGYVPALTKFEVTYSAPISRSELNNGTVRLPVTWTAINRPNWTNLIFEQVLPDGTVVNVELPRPFQWVNSSDKGMVAPKSIGQDADQIVLRVRLADFALDRTFDQLYAYVPIQTSQNAPQIVSFSTTSSSISATVVKNGNARIDVSWDVRNRPNGSNLVFEQILPDGSVRNAELPRDVLIVPSSGLGVVAPIMPSQVTDQLLFRLRLIDLSNNSTLDSKQVTVNLTDVQTGERVYVSGSACYRAPFSANQGVRVGGQGRVQHFHSGADVNVYDGFQGTNVVATLDEGTTFSIEDGPNCSYYNNTNQSFRRWYINAGGQRGWVDEFVISYGDYDDGFIYQFVAGDKADIPVLAINSLSVNPSTVASSEVDNTDFTVSWDTDNAAEVHVIYGDEIPESSYDNGSTVIDGADIPSVSQEILFTLVAHDEQGNFAETSVSATVTSDVVINSFSVSPTAAAGNQQITLTWDISGDYEGASIWTTAPYKGTLLPLHEVQSNTGTFNYTLPDNYPAGDRPFTLGILDHSGTSISETVIVDYACAYSWSFQVNESLCPLQALISRTGAYQAFQRGFMIWLPSDSESMWIFYNDGTAARYADSWDGSDYTIDGTPPDGTSAPERGFGYLWNNTPAVRSGLGWATGAEQGYSVEYQENLVFLNNGDKHYYLRSANGTVIRVSRAQSSGALTWANAN